MNRSELMSRIRSVSKMERDAKSFVQRRAGCTLTHQPKRLRHLGRPDYANSRRKVLVFVHGSFFHGYGYPSRFRLPKTNTGFWRRKIERNRARHLSVVRRARRLGWTVHTVWDFEVR